MHEPISNILVTASLLIIIVLSLIPILPIIYFYQNYVTEISLVNILEEINNGIQKVYSRPLTSVQIFIKLPQGEWIYLLNNTIKFSKKINIELFDPNNIIESITFNEIKYKIKFNEIFITSNVNYLRIICVNSTYVIINQT